MTSDLRQVPAYADLPVLANGLPAAWGVFGDDDDLGTVNFLRPDAVLHAAREEVRSGERINVSLPLNEPDPPFFGRAPMRHTMFHYSPTVPDDVVDNFYLQSSTQWDGLRHRSDPELGFYNGVDAEAAGPNGRRLGIDAWAADGGIVGRAVLVDVARWAARELPGYDPLAPVAIDRAMLESALRAQGQVLRSGDVLLVRTGFMGTFLAASRPERVEIQAARASAGLAADEALAQYFWDNRIAAVAVDNPAVEVLPHDMSLPWLHLRLITMLGMALGEFFDLDRLADACAADGRYTGLFVSVPLNLPGGVGSPANAVVIR
jgi:hypothetical protein